MGRAHALIVDRDPAVRSVLLDGLRALGEIDIDERETIDLPQLPAGLDLVIVELDRGIDDALARLRAAMDASAVHCIGLSRDPADALDPRLDHWLAKPLDDRAVATALKRALRVARRMVESRRRLAHAGAMLSERFVGCSRMSERIRDQLNQGRLHDGPIWLVGENGSGKRHAARLLHDARRRAGRFVVVDCANLSAEGWREAWGDRRLGLKAQADAGTLYLEGLTALAPELQTRLLAELPLQVSGIRLLVGTVDDPRRALDEGRLSSELYDAWAGERIELSALAKREEDVPPLARHLLAQICEYNRLPELGFDAEAMDLLRSYPWPGNVAELHDAMAHAALVARETVKPDDLPETIRRLEQAPATLTLPPAALAGRRFREAKSEVVEAFEQAYLNTLLERHSGNVTAAAHESGMLRSALQRLLRKHGLKSAEFRVRSSRPRSPQASAPG